MLHNVIQGVDNIFNFLASADIKIYGCTCLFAMLHLIGQHFLCPRCFCLAYIAMYIATSVVACGQAYIGAKTVAMYIQAGM